MKQEDPDVDMFVSAGVSADLQTSEMGPSAAVPPGWTPEALGVRCRACLSGRACLQAGNAVVRSLAQA